MSKKETPQPRVAPLQRVVAEAITDPVELAAFEKLRKKLRGKRDGRMSPASQNGAKGETGSTPR
jgi:hypothetical protein